MTGIDVGHSCCRFQVFFFNHIVLLSKVTRGKLSVCSSPAGSIQVENTCACDVFMQGHLFSGSSCIRLARIITQRLCRNTSMGQCLDNVP